MLEGWEPEDKEVHRGGFCRSILAVVCCVQPQRGTGLSISPMGALVRVRVKEPTWRHP